VNLASVVHRLSQIERDHRRSVAAADARRRVADAKTNQRDLFQHMTAPELESLAVILGRLDAAGVSDRIDGRDFAGALTAEERATWDAVFDRAARARAAQVEAPRTNPPTQLAGGV
jgi:hypothetical protein